MASLSIVKILEKKSLNTVLFYGLLVRSLALFYAILHDSFINHIKYTDIDYHVFTNGSGAIVNQRSPYEDKEYRYPPIVALIFVPNILLNYQFGKILLIVTDILCGYLLNRLNLSQGIDASRAKLYLTLWLFNPVVVAISTRGSFEPIVTLLMLTTLYLLTNGNFLLSGLLFGLSIHVKLYPVIYSLSFYGFMTDITTCKRGQNKLYHLLRKLMVPNLNQLSFFSATVASIVLTSYLSYFYYGQEYLDQSFIYHMKRKDLQHNFSVYFYLYRLFPNYQDELSFGAFVVQFAGVLIISLCYLSVDTDFSIRLRKLNFSLFATTFLFVSLNKVCTSQYFNWYLTFLPLILGSLRLRHEQACLLILVWVLSQANWLLFAYLYEYHKFDVLDQVGNSSFLFLASNLWIISTLCKNFHAVSSKFTSNRKNI